MVGHRTSFRDTRVRERWHGPFHRPADREVPSPEPGPPFRILVVGDSFTWGGGVYVEDSYPRRLERRLWAADLPVRVEVETLSRPGWGTVEEAAALARRWEGLRPDLLVVGYVLNDPLPSSGAEQEGLRAPLERRRPETRWSRWLYRRSTVVRFVWERLENTRQRRAFRRHYDLLHSPEQPGWKQARRALGRMAAFARRDGVPAVLVIFPVFDFEQLQDYAYQDVHRLVRRVGRGRGYQVLDLLPAYRAVEGRRLALVPFTDAHPTELAHRLAAEEIARFLLAEGLVPDGEPEEGDGEAETPAPGAA